jgi:hypothetical protein
LSKDSFLFAHHFRFAGFILMVVTEEVQETVYK